MFSNSLLNDVFFHFEIVQLIEHSLPFRHGFKSVCDFGECLKSDLKSVSTSYSWSKEEVLLTNQLSLLKRQLASGFHSV